MKDDHELNSWLIGSALDNARLLTAAAPVDGETLISLVRDFAAAEESIDRLARRYDRHVLSTLAQRLPVPETAEAAPAWSEGLQADLNASGLRGEFRVRFQQSADGAELEVRRRMHGNEQVFNFNNDFFSGADYLRLAALRAKIRELGAGPQEIRRGERGQSVADFDAAYAWLLSEARRGLHIQRYKGLGEMNPEQLHETTLDPKNRRLIRVEVDDAVAADQIFTTLMGEQVEPRREFIERNALLVGNLDL